MKKVKDSIIEALEAENSALNMELEELHSERHAAEQARGNQFMLRSTALDFALVGTGYTLMASDVVGRAQAFLEFLDPVSAQPAEVPRACGHEHIPNESTEAALREAEDMRPAPSIIDEPMIDAQALTGSAAEEAEAMVDDTKPVPPGYDVDVDEV